MQSSVGTVLGFLILCSSATPQERPRELSGGGHLLGETAEHFFSENVVGQLLGACETKDWKTVKQMAKAANAANPAPPKPDVKDTCAKATLVKQQALSGARQEYSGGDDKSMRTDLFTLDGGHLVKINMVFNGPIGNVEGYHPKNFRELFDGLREAYGEPSKSYIESVVDTYGVKYQAHHAEWMGKKDVITINERPGNSSSTEIVVETIAEHNRAAKAPHSENPLQN